MFKGLPDAKNCLRPQSVPLNILFHTLLQFLEIKHFYTTDRLEMQVLGLQVPGFRCRGSRCQVLGVKFQVPGVRSQVPDARCQVPGSMCHTQGIKDQIARDHVSDFRDLVPRQNVENLHIKNILRLLTEIRNLQKHFSPR